MKSHRYWSLGALFCMLGCIYSGIRKSMTAHKYFAYSSLLCMGTVSYTHLFIFRTLQNFPAATVKS